MTVQCAFQCSLPPAEPSLNPMKNIIIDIVMKWGLSRQQTAGHTVPVSHVMHVSSPDVGQLAPRLPPAMSRVSATPALTVTLQVPTCNNVIMC